ncbi:hypothetical protein DPMN_159150, partial [Dreissena polymorpha]
MRHPTKGVLHVIISNNLKLFCQALDITQAILLSKTDSVGFQKSTKEGFLNYHGMNPYLRDALQLRFADTAQGRLDSEQFT